MPEKKNIFLYGTGGVGKTTFLMNQTNSDNSVNFYFPLYRYKQEIHENLQSESCWILLQILLKYRYQYEYQTYETCAACEGESVILRQSEELKGLLKLAPINTPKYTLLLDGINELPSESQEQLVDELRYIVGEWKNVRIIITGLTVPRYDIFDDFRQFEICGVSENERDSVLSVLPDYGDIVQNNGLMEILKTPLFLNMFLDSRETNRLLNTRGEILDSYVMNIQSRLPQDSAVQFVVQYALPFAAKMMADSSYEYKHTDERDELFKKYELDMMWFYNEDDIYRLIGEISGDYKNRYCEDFVYHRTILDSILDMSRNIVTFHTVECVMKSMSLVRDGVLCGVDFSGTNLPIYIPCNIKFSYNGEYPCSFRDSWVFFLSLYDTPVRCTAYSGDNKYLLIALENGYVIMWDSEENRIMWDKDFSEFTEDGREFEYAFFSPDKNVVTLMSCNSLKRLKRIIPISLMD